MTSITVVEMRNAISEILSRAAYGKERFEVMRNGKPVAAIVPIEDIRLLEALEDKLDGILAREGLEAFERGEEPALSLDQARTRLGLE